MNYLEAVESESDLQRYVQPMPAAEVVGEWTIERVRAARRQHDRGQFEATARLVSALMTDPRVYGAVGQRVSTTVGLPVRVVAAPYYGGRGSRSTARLETEGLLARRSGACPPAVREAMLRSMVLAGFAIAQLTWKANEDATRLVPCVEPWPLELSYWDDQRDNGDGTRGSYMIVTLDGAVPIRHGAGKWIVLEPHARLSWLLGAVRALTEPWFDRQIARKYRGNHARAHGSPTPIGELPEGTKTNSPQGADFLRLLRGLRDRGGLAGIKPRGAAIELIESSAIAHQVFESIVRNENSDIALAVLGQDGTASKGSVYTAPVFAGVRFDLIERDALTLDQGLTTGLAAPYAAVNFGEPREYASSIESVVPDPEEDGRLAAERAKWDGYAGIVERLKAAGFSVGMVEAAMLAQAYGVIPLSIAESAGRPSITLTPSDLASVVRVNEARASTGLGPLLTAAGEPDPDGEMILVEFRAKHATVIAAVSGADGGAAPGAPSPAPPPAEPAGQ